MLATRMLMSTSEAPSVELVATSSNGSVNANTWTVSGASFGDLGRGKTRYLIAAITCSDDNGSDASWTIGVTIGGVTATSASTGTGTNGAGASGGVIICIAAVPTGLTGDVVVTLSGYGAIMNGYNLALYRAVGILSATPNTTPTGTTDITLVVPSQGFGLVAAVSTAAAAAGAFSGTGATTAYNNEEGAAMLRTAAGSVVHDSSNADLFRGATWEF